MKIFSFLPGKTIESTGFQKTQTPSVFSLAIKRNSTRALVMVSINLILHFGLDIESTSYLLLKSSANSFTIE